MNRVLVGSPWLALLLLVALSQALPNQSTASPEADARKKQVADAMAAVPLFLPGGWVGEATAVPREAQELLRPNAMLSRLYQNTGRAKVRVLVVHCGDARDMLGHYPPVCYPSSGWINEPLDGEADLVLDFSERRLPVREYMFRGVRDRGQDDVIRIFNAFVLPDGTPTRHYDDINRQSERLSVAVQGVAQVQVITSASVPRAEAIAAAQEVLGGMPEMFAALQFMGPRSGQGEAD